MGGCCVHTWSEIDGFLFLLLLFFPQKTGLGYVVLTGFSETLPLENSY